MATMRSYGDGCAMAHALDLVGERWAMMIVRELMLGPKRFTDIRTGLTKASPNVLSQRLRELEDNGIVRRRRLPPPAAAQVYELTEWGRDLEPVVTTLARWAVRSPTMPFTRAIGVDSVILALRTMFTPTGTRVRVALRLGEDRFVAVVDGERLELTRGESADVEAVLDTDPDTLKLLAFAGLDLAEAVDSRGARVSGDDTAVRRLLAQFALPVEVGSSA